MEEKRVIALGFFDGVHLAHGALLRRVTELAGAQSAIPAALTFDRSPKSMLGAKSVELINTPADRAWLMRAQYGIQEVEVLPFDRAMMELPWDRFITELVWERFHAIHVVAGHDYHFGYRGEGTPEKLAQLCAHLNIGCDIVGRMELDGVTISSTHIRHLLTAGKVDEASRFLGHPHMLTGTVVEGRQVGRTIGIPTANLIVPPGVLTPARGVYVTRVTAEDGVWPAVTNVGIRPTLQDGRGVTVEPWLLDFEGDLYGRVIRVEFFQRLRGEQRFDSLDALRTEIQHNAEQTRAYFQAMRPTPEE